MGYNVSMDIKIFDRIEKKYLINADQERTILKVVKKQMKRDNYHKSEVFNVYFDTDNFDLIIKSIDNPNFKEKLRARSYGGYDKVFLEIKTKLKEWEKGAPKNKVGYKRRLLVTRKDYGEFVAGKKTMEELAERKVELNTDVQIAREVDYLVKTLSLKPRILVYYDRESYVGEGGLRITFDRKLSYRDKDLRFVKKSGDQHFFENPDDLIMEIKAHGVMPLWLVRTLSRERAFPQQFSKIGKIYEVIQKKGEK